MSPSWSEEEECIGGASANTPSPRATTPAWRSDDVVFAGVTPAGQDDKGTKLGEGLPVGCTGESKKRFSGAGIAVASPCGQRETNGGRQSE